MTAWSRGPFPWGSDVETIPAMSDFVSPFEVRSNLLSEPVQVRFVQLLTGIATRHSDTVDCIFRMSGQKVTVGISCAALSTLRASDRKHLSDQQLAETAALFLRRTLERGYDATHAELFLGETELRAMACELGYL